MSKATPSLTHVAVNTRDMDRATAFYADYCGLVEVHRRVEDGITVVWMGEPGREGLFVIVLLTLPRKDAVEPAPLAHLGYAVDSVEEVERLSAKGDADGILVEPAQYAGPIVGHFCIVRDPDGNWVEFSFGQRLGE